MAEKQQKNKPHFRSILTVLGQYMGEILSKVNQKSKFNSIWSIDWSHSQETIFQIHSSRRTFYESGIKKVRLDEMIFDRDSI